MSVMLVGVNDKFFAHVAEQLLRRGIEISHVTIFQHPNFDFVSHNNLFEQVEILDEKNFLYAQYIHTLDSGDHAALSTDVIEKFVQCENLFLSLADRFSFFPVSVQERKVLYQKLLSHWLEFLKISSIEAIFFSDVPHMGWDNILYEVAKTLNILTLCLDKTLKDRVFLLDDFRKIEKVPEQYLNDAAKDEIIQLLGSSFFEDIFQSSSWLQVAQQINKHTVTEREHLLKTLKNWFLRIFEKVTLYGPKLFHNLFSISLLSAVFYNGPYKSVTTHILRLFQGFSIRQLYRFYAEHTSPVNHEKPFVFFALHFQPEKNTTPQGGVFENQLLAVEILAQSVPEGWTIYVKEHPRQFSVNLNSRHYRSIEFYKRLLSRKNVRLIEIREDSEKLIEHAVFTATIKGTAGWQSLLRHKTCMAFGYPWYAACNGCYIVHSVEECQQAIKTILEKSQMGVERDVLKFLAYYRDKFIVSSVSYSHALQSKVSVDILAENLVTAIIERIATYSPTVTHQNSSDKNLE